MTDKTCILMGIDSSTKASGISVYTNGALTDMKLIRANESDSEARMKNMIEQIYGAIRYYKPDIIVIETPTVTRNAKGARELTTVFGAIYGFAVDNNIFFMHYRPSEWRSKVRNAEESVPRKRAEQKQWAIDKVKNEYDVDVSDDVAEAILIGEAYIKEYS